MFPTGQPPFPPLGPGMMQGLQGLQRVAAPQGFMRSVTPFLNNGASGLGGFGARSFGAPGFGGFGVPGAGGVGGSQGLVSQMLGGAGTAAKTGGAGWLSHVQTALKAMQSAAPMVQQYGPMMKNIPAMINMMKIMNEPDDDEDELEENESGRESKAQLSPESSDDLESKDSSSKNKRRQGASQPKLYI
ncbi:VrrA/YqfQ family protein [Halobacillus sp. BBL2006]|uniref:VrrA/YqfQ family protein n=1 Tax=Halobacillus sp. BBL2006 TaxID=1543706 RepID=UPI000543165D|nr:VrrA/YqfQ family protein [Halobacillus sp. BBL2006]KHE66769.1 hypothetical protein LD39_21005 [Halobacillus sp. BBL2006]